MRALVGLAFWVVLTNAALAYPDGAPWGVAKPASGQNCNSCHHDYDLEKDSPLISLGGLPASVRTGETYALTLRFAPSDAEIAGFMLSASAGAFSEDSNGIEANEQEVRSTNPVPAGDGASWRVDWTAPEDLSEEVFFYAVINGADNDASPFGDVIHFKMFEAAAAK